MGSVKRFWAAILLVLPQVSAESLPAAVVHQPYYHQLATAGGMSCTGYQPAFHLAGGTLAEGLRLQASGSITGEPTGIDSGSFVVRITTPCSEVLQEWNWTVRGAPMLFVEPADLTLDSRTTLATALVSASWHGLAYSITTIDGEPAPAWLKVRPRRGRTPPQGSSLTADPFAISVEPPLAPPGATAVLLIHTWQGSKPVKLTVRFAAAGAKVN